MEDSFAPLDGGDAPSGEGTAITDTVDLVNDRYVRVTRTEKVGVQGAHGTSRPSPITDRSARGDEGLRCDLAAKDVETLVGWAGAPVEVHLQGFQVQEREEIVESGGHGPILADSWPAEVTRAGPGRTVA